jgi:hypothetical protein
MAVPTCAGHRATPIPPLMTNPRSSIIARVLLVTAVAMIVAGLYFVFVKEKVVVGAVLMAAGVGDVIGAIVISRQRNG